MSPAAERSAAAAVIGISLKAYFGHGRTLHYCSQVADLAARHPAVSNGDIELFVLPTFTALPDAARILDAAGVGTGGQDLFWEDEGAYTGEVSGKTIAEVGGRYVEVGHAERRRIFRETDEQAGHKLAAAYRNGLTPVLCVGEHHRGSVDDAVAWCVREVEAALSRAEGLGRTARTIVAYEPQWAIGAAEPASPSYVTAVIGGIRDYLLSRPSQAESQVIYGGSAGPGLIGDLGEAVAGLFLGRFAHDPRALGKILDEAEARVNQQRQVLA